MVKIVRVGQQSVRHGVEFAKVGAVAEALCLYYRGVQRRDRALFLHGESRGFIGLTLRRPQATGCHRDSFMTDMLSGLGMLRRGYIFNRSYEHGGVGPFFKPETIVEKVKHSSGQFVYLLRMNHAYVEDPLADLVDALGAGRALQREELTIDLEPQAGMFEVDFAAVLGWLKPLGLTEWTGDQLADYTMMQAANGYSADMLAPIATGPLTVRLGIECYSVDGPYDYQKGVVNWQPSGSVMSRSAR